MPTGDRRRRSEGGVDYDYEERRGSISREREGSSTSNKYLVSGDKLETRFGEIRFNDQLRS